MFHFEAAMSGLRPCRIALAVIAFALVVAAMDWYEVPRDATAFLSPLIAMPIVYTTLIGAWFDLFRVVATLAVRAVYGHWSVCPCTGAHFLVAPPAALATALFLEAFRPWQPIQLESPAEFEIHEEWDQA